LKGDKKMNTMNVKRAFKTMQKNGTGRNYYKQIANNKYLVSNGHVVVTVSENDFEENKQYLKNLEVCEDALERVARDTKGYITETIRMTSLIFNDSMRRQEHIMKSEHGLCAVNEAYISVLNDVGCSMHFEVKVPENGRILTPLVECVIGEDNTVYHCNAVLPINTNVRDVLEKVLS
jgi:hypothetical protein